MSCLGVLFKSSKKHPSHSPLGGGGGGGWLKGFALEGSTLLIKCMYMYTDTIKKVIQKVIDYQ